MRFHTTLLALGAVGTLLALSGCGTEEPGGKPASSPVPTPTPDENEPPRLFPLAIGATWTYRVIDLESGAESSKTRTIEAYEDVGDRKAGVAAYRMRVENANGHSLSWYEDLGVGIGVVRHREQSFDGEVLKKDEFYDAHKLRADETAEHRVTGATWTETYVETKIEPGLPEETEEETRTWTVELDAETITVPAGTFDALRVRRTSPAGGTDKTYWFVDGVGAVKEVEPGKDSVELTTWSFPPID